MRGIMTPPVRVAILDDHQSVVDGLMFRLNECPAIRVVGTANYAGELGPMLDGSPVDVLLLDIEVPMSADDDSLYDAPHAIPGLLDRYPALAIVVITMHDEAALIGQIVETGVSGYVLKDDGAAIRQICMIVELAAAGGVYLSEKASQQLTKLRKNENTLTERQLEILRLASADPDLTSGEIALKLGIAPSTVRNQMSRTYVTLGVRNSAAAIIKAREMGLISPYAVNGKGGEH